MRRFRTAFAAALVLLPTLAMAPAPAADPEVVSISFASSRIDVSGGWGVLTVSLHLRHPDGLKDTMSFETSDNYNVVSIGRTSPAAGVGTIGIERIDRISGTATDGVWSATYELSAGWDGTYTVDQVQLTDLDEVHYYLPVENSPVLTVTGGQPWTVEPVRTPVKVVTGAERWRPQARITNSVTGRPVGGARVHSGGAFDNQPALPRLTGNPGTPADATGLWTSISTYGLQDRIEARTPVYGARGSRGWSLQGIGCPDLTIKLQASASYADTTLTGDQPLTVTGNLWPAPAIFATDAQINLQRNLGAAGWQTVATATARTNGRYTLTWLPIEPGTYAVRVRVPGTLGTCTTGTAGTTLATTTVSATVSATGSN